MHVCVRVGLYVCVSLSRSRSLYYLLPLSSPSLSLLSLPSLSLTVALNCPYCRSLVLALSLTRTLALSLSLLLSPSEGATTGAFYTVVPGYSPDSSPGKWQVLDARVCARTL